MNEDDVVACATARVCYLVLVAVFVAYIAFGATSEVVFVRCRMFHNDRQRMRAVTGA